eukprot:COSAG01_NODE_4409_length_5056_cov_1.452895_1_plen_114_part_10
MSQKNKYVLCLGDGMADEPLASLGQKTPLQVAKTPWMDYLVKRGTSGLVHTVQPEFYPGSDVANMGILGYDPKDYYTGRGPIEAASLDVKASDNQVIFRCNLCAVSQPSSASFD